MHESNGHYEKKEQTRHTKEEEKKRGHCVCFLVFCTSCMKTRGILSYAGKEAAREGAEEGGWVLLLVYSC